MNGAVFTFGRLGGRCVPVQRVDSRCYELGCLVVIVAWVGYVLLRYGGEVGNGIRNRVGAAESEDEAWVGTGVRDGDVAAGVGEERACVPCLGECVLVPHARPAHAMPCYAMMCYAALCWMRPLTVTNSNVSKSRSLQRLAHLKGFWIPRPAVPTQYAMSTMRASSSSSQKSFWVISVLLALLAPRSSGCCSASPLWPPARVAVSTQQYTKRLRMEPMRFCSFTYPVCKGRVCGQACCVDGGKARAWW